MTGGPGLAALTIRYWHWDVTNVLYVIGGLCIVGALMLESFGRIAPRMHTSAIQPGKIRDMQAIFRTRAVYPIAMIALGACVFSGLMTFQMSIMQGTRAHAGAFFGIYAVTVAATRWLLGQLVIRAQRDTATKVLLALIVLGVLATFAVPYYAMFHSASAVLLGTGFGLAYPVIETQVVNESDATLRHAAMTCFVSSYFLGVFGFPALGGWVLVHIGTGALMTLITLCALTALMLAIVQRRRGTDRLSSA